jgi:hypothetical protein
MFDSIISHRATKRPVRTCNIANQNYFQTVQQILTLPYLLTLQHELSFWDHGSTILVKILFMVCLNEASVSWNIVNKNTVNCHHNERQQNRFSWVNKNKTQPPKTSSLYEIIRGSLQEFCTLYVFFLKMNLFYKIHLQAFQCNLHCALSQRSNVWASLVFLSECLGCWCIWLLRSPH